MKHQGSGWRRWMLALCVVAASAVHAQTPGECRREASGTAVTDMSGRKLALPAAIGRVATVGSVPVINGYLLALGAGNRIVNALPGRFTASGRWTMHLKLAPHLAGQPVLQGQPGTEVNLEDLMRLRPDIIVTMDRAQVRALEAARIPVVYLEWANESDIHRNVRMLGCILDSEAQAEAYLRYFDDTLLRVRQKVEGIPERQRPKVLYFNPQTMSTPLAIANWWITQAGGQSMTQDWASGGNAQYSHERLLEWNPDVLIVNSPDQVEAVYRDERFSRLSAVRHQRVHVTPMGSHLWGQRTIEQPLTVLWAASTIHPALFPQSGLAHDIKVFYRQFFGYELSDAEVGTILSASQR